MNKPSCLMVSVEACLGTWAFGSGATINFSTCLGLAGEAFSWNNQRFEPEIGHVCLKYTKRLEDMIQ